MILSGASDDASVVAADVGGVRSNVRDPSGFPERNLAPPVVFVADPRRDPYLDPHLRGIASRLARQLPKFLECGECSIARRISQRHEAITVFGGTPERCLCMPSEPDRDAPGDGTRVDSYIV